MWGRDGRGVVGHGVRRDGPVPPERDRVPYDPRIAIVGLDPVSFRSPGPRDRPTHKGLNHPKTPDVKPPTPRQPPQTRVPPSPVGGTYGRHRHPDVPEPLPPPPGPGSGPRDPTPVPLTPTSSPSGGRGNRVHTVNSGEAHEAPWVARQKRSGLARECSEGGVCLLR